MLCEGKLAACTNKKSEAAALFNFALVWPLFIFKLCSFAGLDVRMPDGDHRLFRQTLGVRGPGRTGKNATTNPSFMLTDTS